MNPHRNLFRRSFEAPADQGSTTIEDEPFNPGPIAFPDEGDVGRQVRESAGLTHRNERGQFTREHDDDTVPGSGPALAEPPAPEAAAPPAPPAPEVPAEDGGPVPLGEPDARYTMHEDGSITLANGHKYASVEALANAAWHAQDTISRGLHKQPEPQQIPDAYEEEQQPGHLLGAGAPLGGEPETIEELLSWAEGDPAAAGRWALANQHRVPQERVRQLYAWWGEQDGADRDAYLGELNAQRAQQQAAEIEQRIMARYEPVLQAQQQAEIDRWDTELNALPYFKSHYEQRVAAELQSEPEFLEEYRGMTAAEKFRVCKAIYAELRVDDSIAQQVAAQTGQAPAAPVPGGAVAAGQAAAATHAAPPVVEGRGGAAPPIANRNDPNEMMKRGVAAYQSRSNLFSPDAPAT